MPDFNTFRMDEQLLGRSFAFRRVNPCLDNINVNNPKYNSNLKVRTIITETFDTYEEWKDYIINGSKKDLEKLLNKDEDGEAEA